MTDDEAMAIAAQTADRSLVADYGLRRCPEGCRGRCKRAVEHPYRGHGGGMEIVSSPECRLMTGAAPRPGEGGAVYDPMGYYAKKRP